MPAPPPPWRIFIVDDHPVMREGLKAVIDSHPSMQLCGEAGEAEPAFKAITGDPPDLAIIDLSMPKSSGLDLISDLAEHNVTTKLLVFSNHLAWVMADRIFEMGAQGYVQKSNYKREIIDAVEAIMDGGTYSSEGSVSDSRLNHPLSAGVRSLALHEFQVFEWLGRGKKAKEIAEKIGCSETTVRTKVERIGEKLGVDGISEVTCAAMQWRLDALL